ncbi:MAG: hypothetical protein ACLFUM_03790 [Spirochaetaceae bacterium]
MEWIQRRRESPEEFWRRTEEDLGEKVLVYAMAKCLRGCAEGNAGVWGLLFVTERALYFRHFPSANWFSAIVQSAGDPGKPREGIYFSVPRSDVGDVSVMRETSLLRRMFTPSPPVMRVSYRDSRNLDAELQLVVESKLERISTLLGGE